MQRTEIEIKRAYLNTIYSVWYNFNSFSVSKSFKFTMVIKYSQCEFGPFFVCANLDGYF